MRKQKISTRFISLSLIILIISCVMEPYPKPGPTLPQKYVGIWQLIDTKFNNIFSPDTNDILSLKIDSTFNSSFSFFLQEDSSESFELAGSWRPDLGVPDRGVFYYLIYLESGDMSDSWKVIIEESDSCKLMKWYEHWFDSNDLQYTWKYLREAE